MHYYTIRSISALCGGLLCLAGAGAQRREAHVFQGKQIVDQFLHSTVSVRSLETLFGVTAKPMGDVYDLQPTGSTVAQVVVGFPEHAHDKASVPPETVRVNFHQPSEVKVSEVSSLCEHWTPSPFVRLETPYPYFCTVGAGSAKVIVSLDLTDDVSSPDSRVKSIVFSR